MNFFVENWHIKSQRHKKSCPHFIRRRVRPCPTHTAGNQSEIGKDTCPDCVIHGLNCHYRSVIEKSTPCYVFYFIHFQNLEEKQALQLFLEENMDNMWRRLQKMVLDFKSDTEEKRRNYNELLSKDKKGVAEVAENNKKIQRLMVSKIIVISISRYRHLKSCTRFIIV